MAIQRGVIRFSGKVGTMVGRRGLGGQYTLSEYQPNVSQPMTAEQLRQKAGFGIASKVAAYLGVLGQQALIANGMSPKRRGALVSKIYAFCESMPSPAVGAVLPASLPLIDNPRYAVSLQPRIDQGAAPSPGSHGDIILSWDALGADCLRKVAALIIYNSTIQTWSAVSAVIEGEGRRLDVEVPPQMLGQLQVYGYVMAVAAGSGAVVGPAYGMGEMVGVANGYQSQGDERLIVGDYRYSQIEGVFEAVRIEPAE